MHHLPPIKWVTAKIITLCALWSCGLLSAGALCDEARPTGPWDMAALCRPPAATWDRDLNGLREVYYEGEPYQGKATRVYALYGRPQGEGPFPAMLLVHGGGGTAFDEWVNIWVGRGYAALAMDLRGQGPSQQRLADGAPDFDQLFLEFGAEDAHRLWSYHAVAAVIRGHSLLAAQNEVDAARIGVTGISWGGYTTCVVAGLDDRLKVAVPVYGCGFLHHNSAWTGDLERLGPAVRDRWVRAFDPSSFLPRASCPMLWINGTNDFAYPLDSYQKSYDLVPAPVTLTVKVRLKHGHHAGWEVPETYAFVDHVLRGGKPLAHIDDMTITGDRASAAFECDVPIVAGALHYAKAEGRWQDREWLSVDAETSASEITAELPAIRPLVCYLSITDERGLLVSTPHAIVE